MEGRLAKDSQRAQKAYTGRVEHGLGRPAFYFDLEEGR